MLRRAQRAPHTCPEAGPLGESKKDPVDTVLSLQPLKLLVCNCQSFLHKVGEINKYVLDHNVHAILCQETWLDASVEEISFPNFTVTVRRDRSDHPNRRYIDPVSQRY